MEKIRCFVAVNFPDEILNEIEKIQEELNEKKIFNGKLTERKNLHLTLKFLGEISLEDIEKVKKRLRGIKIEGFEAGLGGLGVFSSNNIRIVWIKILGKEICELQERIDGALSDIFPKEKRFMGHLTIARVKSVQDRKLFFDGLKKIFVDKKKFLINEFELVKSELKPEGPEYEILERFNLDNFIDSR